MKYCIDFQENASLLLEADEINIKYNRKNTHIEDFLNNHPSHTVNICLEKEEDLRVFLSNKEIDILEKLLMKYKYRIRLGQLNQEMLTFATVLQNKKIPFYFNVYVNNWDLLLFLIKIGVQSVYITESLGFELDKVSKVTKEKGIELRVFPNVCQIQWPGAISDIKHFFIRPEDIDIYEPYVDIVEFWGELKNTETFLNIYKKDRKWFGSLDELIINFNTDLDSRFILPRFAERRIRCNRECLKGGKCSLCDTIDQLSKTLKENNIIIKKEK